MPSGASATVRILPARWDDPDVRQLAAAQQAELRERYEGGEEPGTPPSAADVAVVLVARAPDGSALGCGALRPLGDDVAELKRMYVTPAARGRGHSKALLAALEDEAHARGWTTLRLETGPRQPEAIALYVGAGYREVAAFGAYADSAEAGDSLFFERVLVGERRADRRRVNPMRPSGHGREGRVHLSRPGSSRLVSGLPLPMSAQPPPPEPPFLRALPSARPTDTELMARAVAEPDVFATLFDRHAAAVSAVTETAGEATCGQRR